MKLAHVVSALLVAQALGGCGGCSKEEIEPTPAPPASEPVSLSGQKIKAPGLKGVMAKKHQLTSEGPEAGADAVK